MCEKGCLNLCLFSKMEVFGISDKAAPPCWAGHHRARKLLSDEEDENCSSCSSFFQFSSRERGEFLSLLLVFVLLEREREKGYDFSKEFFGFILLPDLVCF